MLVLSKLKKLIHITLFITKSGLKSQGILYKMESDRLASIHPPSCHSLDLPLFHFLDKHTGSN